MTHGPTGLHVEVPAAQALHNNRAELLSSRTLPSDRKRERSRESGRAGEWRRGGGEAGRRGGGEAGRRGGGEAGRRGGGEAGRRGGGEAGRRGGGEAGRRGGGEAGRRGGGEAGRRGGGEAGRRGGGEAGREPEHDMQYLRNRKSKCFTFPSLLGRCLHKMKPHYHF